MKPSIKPSRTLSPFPFQLKGVTHAAILFGLALVAPMTGQATTITTTTTLTFLNTGMMTPIAPTAITEGDKFVVTLAIDTSILDVEEGSNAYGPSASFPGAGALLSITRDPANVGSWAPETLSYSSAPTFTIVSNNLGVTRAVNIDFYFSDLTLPKSTSGSFIWTQMKFNFAIDPLGVDTGTGQPLSDFLPGPEGWGSYTVHNYFTDPDDFMMPGIFVSYSQPELIPEPSTYALAALGVSLGLFLRKRRTATA